MNEIHQLWRDHQADRFPEGAAGEEVEGEDLVSLDSFTAGCISTFLGQSGLLAPDQLDCLIRCRDDLGKVLPKLDGEARGYYSRLYRMSQLALQALGK